MYKLSLSAKLLYLNICNQGLLLW